MPLDILLLYKSLTKVCHTVRVIEADRFLFMWCIWRVVDKLKQLSQRLQSDYILINLGERKIFFELLDFKGELNFVGHGLNREREGNFKSAYFTK